MESQYSLTNEEIDDLVEIASKSIDHPLTSIFSTHYLTWSTAHWQNNRILGIRTDLRFAQSHVPGEPDLPICFQRDDEQAITRFFESLKSQLRADHNRSKRPGDPHYHLMDGAENVIQAYTPLSPDVVV
jgi:hypothetical protein